MDCRKKQAAMIKLRVLDIDEALVAEQWSNRVDEYFLRESVDDLISSRTKYCGAWQK